MAVLLLVTAQYPFGDGEQFVEAELNQLTASGHEVLIAPTRRPGRPRTLSPGVTLVARSCLRGSLRDAARSIVGPTFETGGRDAVVRALAASIIAGLGRRRPDVVHGYWAAAPASVAAVIGARLGIPWGFTAHRYDIFDGASLAQKLIQADAVRFISRDGWRLGTARTGLAPASSWFVQPLGVEVPENRAVASSPHDKLLAIGRFIPIKGFGILLEALALTTPSVGGQLDIIGGGPLETELRGTVRRLGLTDRVTFRGVVQHDKVLDILVREPAAALVCPSFYEGIPVSVIEAMARSRPAVATAVGGVPELVDDSCGWLVPSGDVGALATAIARVRSTEVDELRRKGQLARSRVLERHDARVTAAHFADAIGL